MAMGESESSCLIDSISQFSNIFDKSILVPGPALAYYENLVELLLLLRPVLDCIVNSEIASDGHLTSRTEELDTIINDANKSLECWNPMMSKIHSLLQIDAISLKIEISVGKMCNSLNSLKLAANVTPIQQFLHQLESLREKQASAAVRDVLKSRKENIPPSAASLALITDILNLSSNQELLMEAVCLDKAKLEAMHENRTGDVELINHLIELVVHMHDSFVKIKQSQLYNGMPIPPDFCCPLSLEPMSDPVIVASGQTYERAFIRNWLDRGLTVCPKTRQTLAHTNLIPNFTVKALIANWCETNHIKLPDPTKSMKLIQPVNPLANGESVVKDVHYLKPAGMKVSDAAKADKKVPLNGKHVDVMMDDKTSRLLESQSASAGPSVSCSTHIVGNGHEERAAKHHASTTYENGHVVCSEQNLATLSPSQPPMQDSVQGLFDEQAGSHNRCSSISSTVSSADGHTEAGDATEVSSDVANDNSDHSGEVSRGSASAASPRDPEFPTRLSDLRSRNHSIWRRGPDRGFVPRITSATSTDTRTNLSEVEAEVRKLVDGLQNSAIETKRESAIALRHLARHNMENRIVIANCGAINLLVDLLHSGDVETQENAVTALLNLSLNDNNKSVIANAGAIEPLIHVLQTGSAEAKENSAATLFSLSVIEENKVRIGRSGAIPPLVDLLGNGTPRGKKDAATALFNLSIFHENKARIVQAGAVRHLVELMDPAAGMVDKAVAVLSNLSTIQEGRTAIGQEGGIPVLVEVVELGSSRGKENAAAALLQLCTNNPKFCHMVLQEGAVPPLVALSQSGTPRAKEKAQQLLSYFRSQRHGNVGRG